MISASAEPTEDEELVGFTAEEREKLERLRAFDEAYLAPRPTGDFPDEQQARLDYWDSYIEDLSLDMEIEESVERVCTDSEGTKYLE